MTEINPVETSNPEHAPSTAIVPDAAQPTEVQNEASSSSYTDPKRQAKASTNLEPLEDILLRRVTTIKEGDNVLLKLPSDAIKAVVASKDG
jgi:tRNA (adenine-N(1)-)-methyltransferase non-catalytic subunit